MGSDTTRYILVDRERIRRVTKGDEQWFLTLGCGHRIACDVVVLSEDVAIDPVDPHLPACPNIDQLCQQEGCVREVLVRDGRGRENPVPDIGEVIDEVVDREGWTPGKIEGEDTDDAEP